MAPWDESEGVNDHVYRKQMSCFQGGFWGSQAQLFLSLHVAAVLSDNVIVAYITIPLTASV